jgi:hypothetical protein
MFKMWKSSYVKKCSKCGKSSKCVKCSKIVHTLKNISDYKSVQNFKKFQISKYVQIWKIVQDLKNSQILNFLGLLEISEKRQKCDKPAQTEKRNWTGNMGWPICSIRSVALCSAARKHHVKRRKGAPEYWS